MRERERERERERDYMAIANVNIMVFLQQGDYQLCNVSGFVLQYHLNQLGIRILISTQVIYQHQSFKRLL